MMNKKNYSFIMMDTDGFLKYQKMCQKNKIPCHYNQINANTYGVMIGNEKKEGNVELVEEAGEK